MTDPNDTPDESRIRKRISVVETDEPAADMDASITATMVESAVTPERTAQVRISFENTDNAQTFHFGASPPLSSHHTQPTGLYLYSLDNEREKHGPKCWKPDLDINPDQGHAYAGYGTKRTLEPGERLERTFEVWGDPRLTDDCLPVGTYRVESSEYGVEVSDRPDEETEFTWGFSLRVAE